MKALSERIYFSSSKIISEHYLHCKAYINLFEQSNNKKQGILKWNLKTGNPFILQKPSINIVFEQIIRAFKRPFFTSSEVYKKNIQILIIKIFDISRSKIS